MSLWNNLVIIFNTLLGIYIFHQMWKYINREMKTSPSYTRFDKIKNFFSAFVFSTLTTLTILFVISFITSTIATNALYALRGTDVEEELIIAWQFPNFLPITLIILTGYAFVYPLYEYFLLAQPEKQAIMEIQDYMENKVIQRVRSPWSYLIALIIFLVIVVLTPAILSAYMVYIEDITAKSGGSISQGWVVGLIFFAWAILGPTIYLSYYSKLGAAHIVYRAKRVDLKKDKKTTFYFVIAILSVISTIFSFFRYIPIIWGSFPKTTTNYTEAQGGAIQEFIELVIPEESIAQWQNFNAIFPLDFLLFILTTVIISFIGFYIKFLRKEPINRSSIVLFAAYIFIGTAFTIFLNAMIKWPWVFPDQSLSRLGLYLDFNNPNHQDIIVRLFSTTILVEKTLNMGFLIYFFFFNPEIKKNANEWVLNRAILKNKFEKITDYAKNPSPEIRKMSLNSIISYVKLRDKLDEESSKHISEVLGDLLMDEDPEISRIVDNNITEIIQKLWLDKITDTLIKMLKTDNEKYHKQATILLKKIANQDPNRAGRAFDKILRADLSEQGKKKVLTTLKETSQKIEGVLVKLFFSLIYDKKNDSQMVITLLETANITFNQFLEKEKYLEKLKETLKTYIDHRNAEIVSLSLRLYAKIVQVRREEYDHFLEIFKNIPDSINVPLKILRSKIGVIIQLIDAFPEYFFDLFDYLDDFLIPEDAKVSWKKSTKLIKTPEKLEEHLDEEHKIFPQEKILGPKERDIEIKSDIALALGSISTSIDVETFSEVIFPHIIQLIKSEETSVKESTLKSIILIAKTRQDIYEDPSFQLLLGKLLIDDEVSIRKKIYNLILQLRLEQLLIYILDYLKRDLHSIIRIEMINVLTNLASQFHKKLVQFDLPQILINQNFSNQKVIDINEFYKNHLGEISFFNVQFREQMNDMETIKNLGNLSVEDATLALFFTLSLEEYQIYEKYKNFLENRMESAGSIAKLKMLDFKTNRLLRVYEKHPEKMKDRDLLLKKLEPIDSYLQSTNELIEVKMMEFLLELLEKSKIFHSTVFEKSVILVFKHPIDNNSVSVIKIFTKIITQLMKLDSKYYMSIQNITNPKTGVGEEINPFEQYIKPFIRNIIKIQDKTIYIQLKRLFDVLFKVRDEKYDHISKEEKDFRQLLGEQTYQDQYENMIIEILENDPKIISKVRAIKLLIRSPYDIKTERISQILMDNIKTKNPKLKASIIDAVGRILRNYKTFPEKRKPKEYRTFRKLLIHTFIMPYDPKAHTQVKQEIVKHLPKILVNQPFVPMITQILREIGMDPDPDIAKKAISAYFKFLELYDNTKKRTKMLSLLYNFANNENMDVINTLINNIINLYQKGVEIKEILPTLMKLASSPNKEIRDKIFSVFEKMYNKEPENFIFFIDIIMKLINHKDVEIRRDASKALFSFIFKKPSKLEENKFIFRSFRNLALDEDLEVRIIVSEFLVDLINAFPERIKEILDIIFIFIKSGENETMQNTAYAVKLAINKYPKYKDEVIDSLKRYYKKSQDGMLFTLINQLEGK